jgi:hypothetical protein
MEFVPAGELCLDSSVNSRRTIQRTGGLRTAGGSNLFLPSPRIVTEPLRAPLFQVIAAAGRNHIQIRIRTKVRLMTCCNEEISHGWVVSRVATHSGWVRCLIRHRKSTPEIRFTFPPAIQSSVLELPTPIVMPPILACR